MKSADCYVKRISIVDDTHAVAMVQPLDDSCCYGDWTDGRLNPDKEYEWDIDVSKFGRLRFIEFYVSYRVWDLDNKIPESKFHVILDFESDNKIIGISKGNGVFV